MSDNQTTDNRSLERKYDRRRFLQATACTAILGSGTATASRNSMRGPDSTDSESSFDSMDRKGTEENPFVVTTVAELQRLFGTNETYFELGSDIDARATATWNDGAGFEPIETFYGALDGRGYEIRGLHIDRPDRTTVGIFAELEGTVRNLHVEDATIRGQNEVGVLAGKSINATVESVRVSGHVSGRKTVGGMIGRCALGSKEEPTEAVADCVSHCQVRGTTRVGGLLGRITRNSWPDITVADSVAHGPVIGDSTVGGLIGTVADNDHNSALHIKNCRANGSVSGNDSPTAKFGGLVGRCKNVTITGAVATGSVDAVAAEQVGGLVGKGDGWETEILSGVSTGTVEGHSAVGGLVGRINEGTIRECVMNGAVTGTEAVGGIIGKMSKARAEDLYAAGDVTGDRRVGGVLGSENSFNTNYMYRALATGSVDGSKHVGGVVGKRGMSFLRTTYWDAEANGEPPTLGHLPVTGVTTSELQGEAAETTLEKFDFESVWTTRPDEYPTLRSVDVPTVSSSLNARIRNLRLVQTVENSRVLTSDAEGAAHLDAAPVADEVVRGESHPDIAWTASEADFAAKRCAAPVFDLRVNESDALSEPVTLTCRLFREGEVFREWTGTLAPDAVAGNDRIRQARIEEVWGYSPPEQLPLLEMLVDNPDAISGGYPIFPAGAGSELELEVDGPDLAESVTAHYSIDSDRIQGLPPLSIGIVGLEGRRMDTDYSYTFDDVDLTAFADSVADQLLSTFPTRSVTTAVREELHSGYDGLTGPHSTAIRASNVMSESLDEAHVVRHTADNRRESTVDTVNVTIGVVPEGFFDGQKAGVVPTVNDRPVSDAVLVETGDEKAAAHEVAHYFIGDQFSDPDVAMNGKDTFHASNDLTSTGYAIQDGEFEVLPGRTSLMAYNTEPWADAHTYQGLIESRFRPEQAPTREVAGEYLGAILAKSREQYRSLQALPEETVDRLSVAVDDVSDQLADQIETVSAAVASTNHYREVPDLPETEFWERLTTNASDLRTIGQELQEIDVQHLDSGETTVTVGEQLEHGSSELRERARRTVAHTRRDGVDFVLDIEGHLEGDGLDIDADVVPVLGAVNGVDGAGTIDVDDSDGNTLTPGSVTTATELITAGGESMSTGDVVIGAVRIPEAAATVEITVSDENDDTHTATIDPVTDPIRKRIESLPQQAFVDPNERDEVLGLLDDASDSVAEGKQETANETLATVRQRLVDGIRTEYTPSGGAPSRDDVLSMVEVQETRFESESAGHERFVPWVLGGLACSGLGLYLNRYRGEDTDEPAAGETPS